MSVLSDIGSIKVELLTKKLTGNRLVQYAHNNNRRNKTNVDGSRGGPMKRWMRCVRNDVIGKEQYREGCQDKMEEIKYCSDPK